MPNDESESIRRTFFQKIRHLLIDPPDDVQSDILRMNARILSFALLLIVILLPLIQLVLGILLNNIPLFFLANTIFLLIYIISRTKYVVMAGIITTLCLAAMPYLFLLVEFNREPMRVALNVILWPLIAALFGSQWLTSRLEALLITGETSGLLIFCNLHPDIGLIVALEPIIDQAALSLVVLFFTFSLNYYVTQLEDHKKFLEQRQKELEVYASVLTHDLGNDLQIVKGHIELLFETLNIPQDKRDYLTTSIAVSDRMASVIKLFSVVGRTQEYDFIQTLRTMTENASKASGGGKISLFIGQDVQSTKIRPGVLLPLVLENLIRNTLDYAGEKAVVSIKLGFVEGFLHITYRDNGPGIDPEIRPRIFQKGITTGGESKGFGLYLSKRIVESYGGTIELKDPEAGTGAVFLISVPAQ
ncbi:MAG: sensor histidine kinase [Candidatus Thorarchaeota archaeon]